MEYKYWEILLTEWRRQGKKGLSIPFLIGSQIYLQQERKKDNIADLILNIATNNNVDVYISYCTDINDLILGIRDDSKKTIAGRFAQFQNGSISSLFVTKIVYDLDGTIEEIINALIDRYQHFIDEGKYSINEGERGEFSFLDQSFIKASFKDKKLINT